MIPRADGAEHLAAVSELLDTIYEVYHHDFRAYARGSIERGIERTLAALEISTVRELIERIRRDRTRCSDVLEYLTVQVSGLFRDPEYYRAFRERVVPYLATYPSIRIWVAGCGTGEEAYSIAVVLLEENLLERALVYATDIDRPSLDVARRGSYDAGSLDEVSGRYLAAGGRASFADYVESSEGCSRLVLQGRLRERIFFSDHSLSTDAAFAEVQFVSCRNVFIYFDPGLRDRVVGLFLTSLCSRGFLGLGAEETLADSSHAGAFEYVARRATIYRLLPTTRPTPSPNSSASPTPDRRKGKE